jgi:hypothetical protein
LYLGLDKPVPWTGNCTTPSNVFITFCGRRWLTEVGIGDSPSSHVEVWSGLEVGISLLPGRLVSDQ